MGKVTQNIPPKIQAYRAAMDAWNLRVSGWLGLDPDQVFDLQVEDHVRGHVVVQYNSLKLQHPTRGHVVFREFWDGERTQFIENLIIERRDELQAFVTEVGPKPELFTPAERAKMADL